MKKIYLLLFTLLCNYCLAQEGQLLIKQKLITDFSELPIFPRLIEKTSGQVHWKEEFKYLDSIEIYRIVYLSDGLKITGLVVKPKKKGKYPCIIFNRGGSKDFGALTVGLGATRLGRIAKEGYVMIASNYRGNGNSEGKEEFGGSDINDVLILPKILEEIESADTDKIGMYGWSRGGMMTYLALAKMKEIKAAAVGGAKSDLTIIDRPRMEKGVYEVLIPNYKNNKEVELKKRSAIFWVEDFPATTPILLLHGNADWRVKSTNSLKLALEFEKHRIPYRLKIFEGGDHQLSEFRQEVDQEIIDWFNKFLKKDEPLPNMEYHGR